MIAIPVFRGLTALHEKLLDNFRAGRVLHAYLLSGDPGTGKRSFSETCVLTLLCEAGQKPCGVCPACRRVLGGNHPDVHLFEKDNSIKIAQVRALHEWLKNRAWEGTFRCVLIPDAHAMTQQAQNALLKSLEEPQEGVVFFLMTDKPQALLPTIDSRCMHIPMPLLPDEDIAAILMEAGIPAEDARECASLAGGSTGKAKALLEDSPVRALRAELLRAFSGISRYGDIPRALSPVLLDWKDKILALETAEDIFLQAARGEKSFTMRQSADMIITIEKLKRMAQSNVSMNAIWNMLFIAALEGTRNDQNHRRPV